MQVLTASDPSMQTISNPFATLNRAAKGKWDAYARRRFHDIRDSSRMSRYPEEALGLSGGYRAFRGENRL